MSSHPQDHFDWSYSLASTLQKVAYASTLDEAKFLARNRLIDLCDEQTGLPGASPEVRQSWQVAAAHAKENYGG